MSEEIAPLVFRVYVAGKLVREDVVPYGPHMGRVGEAVRVRHAAISQAADREGKVWLMEAYDADMPEGQQYRRIGTDTAGMVNPQLPGEGGVAEVTAVHLALCPKCGNPPPLLVEDPDVISLWSWVAEHQGETGHDLWIRFNVQAPEEVP